MSKKQVITLPTLAAPFSWYMDGSSAGLLAAPLVAPMRSERALATSLIALINTTYKGEKV